MPPAPEVDISHVISVIQSDLPAANFLVSLLHLAASTSRHPTTLIPVPAPYLTSSQQCDIHTLRTHINSLPPLHLTQTNPHQFIRSLGPYKKLLEHALFHMPNTSSTPPMLLSTIQPRSVFPKQDVIRGREERRFRLNTPHARISQHPSVDRIEAFHGSAVENWYSIVRTGLRIRPDLPYNVANGRLHGDAAYLSNFFPLALSFAPFTYMNAACVPIKGMCIVGRFAVRQDACASDVDDAYVVVREEGALELEDICVLEQSHIHSLSSKNSIVNMCRTHGLSLLVILYLLILAYISTG